LDWRTSPHPSKSCQRPEIEQSLRFAGRRVLDAENTVQPDLVFVSSAKLGVIQQRAIFGTPDLLVELVSLSSVRRDRYDKKELYARFGVEEYWIGDPANKTLEILTLKEGLYELQCCAEEKGKLSSPVLAGLEFDLSEIQ
jgi:Uma2 family endonuclease